MFPEIIAIIIIVLIIGGASFYIYKAKKNGKKCIGCPDSGSCYQCSGCHKNDSSTCEKK